MAVMPVGADATGVQVYHAEMGHGGTIPWADVGFARGPTGAPSQHFVTLPCPVAGCGSVSVHPVSGGADRDAVQELFAQVYQRAAAALGLPAATIEEARALVKQRAAELERR